MKRNDAFLQILVDNGDQLKLTRQYAANNLVNFLFGLFLFLGLTSGGAWWALQYGTHADLQCRRLEPTQVNCELRHVNLVGREVARFSLEHAARARLAEVEMQVDGDAKTGYQVILDANTGFWPLTRPRCCKRKYQRKVKRINDFLADPRQDGLRVTSPIASEMYYVALYGGEIFGGVFALAGLVGAVLFLFGQRLECEFDHRARVCRVQSTTRLTRTGAKKTFPYDPFTQVDMKKPPIVCD